MISDLIRDIRDDIERAYVASGNNMGWRFLYSPAEVLDNAEVAFIGKYPGGRFQDPSHGVFAMAQGSAYRDEPWEGAPAGKAKLQRQVLALFSRLGETPESVLAGNLVPFRSPDWSDARKEAEAVRFGTGLWRRVLARARPRIVVTMGSHANDAISAVLGVTGSAEYPTGWGSYVARRGSFTGGTWIGLPLLSRFAIMTRPESAAALDRLFDGLTG